MSVLSGSAINGASKRNTVCTKLSDAEKAALDALVAKTGKSKSEILREAFRVYIKAQEDSLVAPEAGET